jgi:hypothetical protein
MPKQNPQAIVALGGFCLSQGHSGRIGTSGDGGTPEQCSTLAAPRCRPPLPFSAMSLHVGMSSRHLEQMHGHGRNNPASAENCYRECECEQNEFDEFPRRQWILRCTLPTVTNVRRPRLPIIPWVLRKTRINICLRAASVEPTAPAHVSFAGLSADWPSTQILNQTAIPHDPFDLQMR